MFFFCLDLLLMILLLTIRDNKMFIQKFKSSYKVALVFFFNVSHISIIVLQLNLIMT